MNCSSVAAAAWWYHSSSQSPGAARGTVYRRCACGLTRVSSCAAYPHLSSSDEILCSSEIPQEIHRRDSSESLCS